jgi:hypothetical protein
VGLEVEPNAHILLKAVYEETIVKCGAIPDSYAYKANLIKFANERLDVLRQSDDHAVIEAKFDDGRPIEETLAIAKDELSLIDDIVAKQYWTMVNPDKVEVIILPPGVHHEDRLDLIRADPSNKAKAAQ